MTRRLLLPLLFGLAGTAILISLGIWQLQRLTWKESVLAEIDARIGGAPAALPASPDPGTDRFLPVRLSGETEAREILVQASAKRIGPGFRVITPFVSGGRRILLDRGFIRAGAKADPRPALAMTVEGNLHWPDEVDGFTPEPDPDAGLWFARDVAGMAAHLETEPVLVILRAASVEQPGIIAFPVDSAGIPNDHLQYAITWFLLAAVWVGMTIYLLRRRDT